MLLNEPTLVSFNRIIFTTSLYFSLWVNTSVPAFVRPSFALTSIRITSPLFCVTKSISILKLSFHSYISLVIFLLNSIFTPYKFRTFFSYITGFSKRIFNKYKGFSKRTFKQTTGFSKRKQDSRYIFNHVRIILIKC